MKLNDLNYQYAQLMAEAGQCTSRQEALTLINRATRLRDTINLMKESEALLNHKYTYTHDRLHDKVGGKFGSDDFVERWHWTK